ncbi:MAG: Phosphoglycolate phosphatase [Pseudomonadota bacterium]|jgi:phosphoglycolate phosphatase
MSSTLRYRAILFDLDGTLAETAPEIADALNDTLLALGHAAVDSGLAARWIGHGTRELLIQGLAHARGMDLHAVRDDPRLPEVFATFDGHYERRTGTRSHLYPGVREALETLRAHHCRLAVVTNKEGRHTDTVLRAHGLSSAFDMVISGDTLPTKKPNPSGVLHCLQRWGVAPQDALFVGDSSIDAQTARQAGVSIFLMSYGYNMGADVRESRPDRVLDHFSQVMRAVLKPGQSASP